MKKKIHASMERALHDAGFPAVPFSVERSDAALHGDYACNAAMIVAQATGKRPREVFDVLHDALRNIAGVDTVACAGSGFINFHLSRDFFPQTIHDICALGERWGMNDGRKGQEVLVEYASPNLFKPLHVGNLVGTIVGESIARLFTMNGGRVRRITYPCDVGMTVAKAVWGLKKINGNPENIDSLGEAYRFGNEAYENDAEAKKEIEDVNAAIYRSDEKTDTEVVQMYRRGREFSLAHINRLCKALGTSFDTVIFESETGPVGKELVESHIKDGVFEKDGGAVVFHGERHGLHTRVFLNSRGLPTYETKELGNFILKRKRYPGADTSLVVTGSEQKEYFTVLNKVLAELFDADDASLLEHIATGFLTLSDGKMSSRKGNVLTGESLLKDLRKEAVVHAKESRADDISSLAEDIAVGALKYQILRIKNGSPIVFDRKQAFSFTGDSGPYVQYTRARIISVLQKAQELGIAASYNTVPDTVYPAERIVCQFAEVVEESLIKRSPHMIVSYATALASAFNTLYASERIADPAAPFSGYFVAVSEAVGLTLERALWALGIPAPDQM